jgi:hypothetical protein
MTAAPFTSPSAPIPAATPVRPSSNMAARFGLAVALWAIWCVPMAIIALTGAKFAEIFKEFGLKVGAVERIALQLALLLASPMGLVFMLVLLPVLCFAVAALILPARTASAAASEQPARWPLVVIAVIGSVMGSAALWITFMMLMSLSMSTVVDKLNQQPPAAPAANTPAAPVR